MVLFRVKLLTHINLFFFFKSFNFLKFVNVCCFRKLSETVERKKQPIFLFKTITKIRIKDSIGKIRIVGYLKCLYLYLV